MKSNKIVWAKTVLFAYKYLEPMSNAIDKIIKNMAVKSYYCGGDYDDCYNCEKLSSKMICLTNKKIDYINLKVVVEKALKNMNETLAKILILRNIKELSISTVTSIMNMSERSYFRKLALAEEQFAKVLERLNYGVYKLELDYSSDNFIKSIYNIINNDNSNITSLSSNRFDNSVINGFLKNLAFCY